MKICRFDDNRVGLVEDDAVYDVTAALDILPACRYPLPRHDLMIAHLDDLKPRFAEARRTAKAIPLGQVKLLSPVANPGKICAAPINYQAHIDNDLTGKDISFQHQISHISNAGIFLKAASSMVGPGEGVTLAFPDRRNDHEIELVIVIGKAARNVSEAHALDHVAGYCMGLDMTIRGPEDRSFRKSIDTFSVVGPWLVTVDELPDASNLGFELKVNGEPRQKANTAQLVYGVRKLIAYASSFYTLQPGDIFFTGTPDNVAPVVGGDVMTCRMDGIGTMEVRVRT